MSPQARQFATFMIGIIDDRIACVLRILDETNKHLGQVTNMVVMVDEKCARIERSPGHLRALGSVSVNVNPRAERPN